MDFSPAAFLSALQSLVMKQLAAISLSESEKKRLFSELAKISEQIDQLLEKSKQSYSASFSSAIDFIMENFEGERSNEKFDRGRATMFGISERAHPEYKNDIINGTLSKDVAKRIYYDHYWSGIYGVNELHPAIAFIIFDARIHGSRESIRDIQRYLNANVLSDSGVPLKVDGVFGKKSFDAIQKMDESSIPSLLDFLLMNAPANGKLAAQRVLKLQKREGLPIYDYTNGFTNRLVKRYNASAKIYRGESLHG